MKSFFGLLLALSLCTGSLAISQTNQYILKIEPSGTGSTGLIVNPGQIIQFSAKAYQTGANGTLIEVQITSINWSVNPASLGTITAQGEFTAAALNSASSRGTITAIATVGNMTLHASVAVVLSIHPQNSCKFSGNVSSSAGPISGAHVSVMGSGLLPFLVSGKTDNLGNYSIDVPAGTYIVRAEAAGYLSEYFDNVATPSLATTFVTDPAIPTITGIDFVLGAGGHIRGTVLAAAGNAPLAGAIVFAAASNGTTNPPSNTGGFHAITNAHGDYDISGLPDGQYIVRANKIGFATQYYNGKSDITNADAVTISSGASVDDVDFSLGTYGGSIAGTILDGNGNPIADAVIAAWINGHPSTNAASVVYGKAVSALDGSYTITGLPPGDFVVRVQAHGYIAEFYDNVTDFTLAILVTVANQPVTGIDFELAAGGSISGTVTNEDTNGPLASATVIVRSTQHHFERGAHTDAHGNYFIDGLPGDDYTVFAAAHRFIGEYYDNAATATLATTITVAGTSAITGINFALTPAPVAPRLYRGTVVAHGGATGLLTVVEAINPTNGMVLATSTDAQGGFEFHAWDNAVLRARALGYVGLYAGDTRNWQESRWEGAQAGMTFTLDPVAENGMAALRGQVKDAGTGTGITDAWVYGMDAEGSIYFAVSGSAGEFSIPNTANGSLDVMVSQVGFETGTITTEITNAQGSATIDAQRTGVTSVEETAARPSSPILLQNYPNPFNPATTISYAVPERMHVSIRVYNLLGSEVGVAVDGIVNAGTHSVTWDASHLPSGIYMYRLEAASTVQMRRMTFMK